jgi:hypothetical protein
VAILVWHTQLKTGYKRAAAGISETAKRPDSVSEADQQPSQPEA